jgi:hypothetical protein
VTALERCSPAAPGRSARGLVGRLLYGRRSARDEAWARAVAREDLRDAAQVWRLLCEGLPGLHRRTSTVTGPTIGTPFVRHVSLTAQGAPRLLVELRPGMVPADVEQQAVRIAAAYGGRTLRVSRDGRAGSLVWVEVISGPDPLAASFGPDLLGFPETGSGVVGASSGVVLGRAEDGSLVSGDVVDWPHVIMQGSTTSGKSAALRWVLAQIAHRVDVRVVGSDPSGSLWRPWPVSPSRVTGLGSVEAHAVMLEAAVAEMDRRLAGLPVVRDRVETGPGLPLWLIVLEEYPGLLRGADAAGKEVGRRVRAAVARLLAESHKAGMRVWLLAQRADATLIGGFERSNLGLRVSFRSDKDALKMLHALADEVVDAHVAAAPGVGLLSGHSAGFVRFRAPLLTYPAYVGVVSG